MSKGSSPRPQLISNAELDVRWELAFGKKKAKPKKKDKKDK